MSSSHNLTENPVISDLANFDKKSGNLLERIVFNNRALFVALCILLTTVLGYQATKLQLGASFEKMIPTKHPYIANYLANKSDLVGVGNAVRIAVENTNGTIFEAGYLETLRKINDELFLLPGVERPYMKSLWTPATRWMGATEDGFEGGPVIEDSYNGSPESLQRLRENIARSGEVGSLVSPNFKSSIIVVPLLEKDESTGSRLDYKKFSDNLEQIRAKYEGNGIKIYITGFAKIVGDLISSLRIVLSFFFVAIVICTVFLYWYTRCIRSTLLVVSCSLIAVIWLLGLLPTLGYELDPYSMLVPFLVFAIGMSHGAQKMNGIMQDIGRGTHKAVAARYTFRRLILAGLTALLADGVGFAVLMVIQIQVIQDLAITASIGMCALIFTNLFLLPVLLSFFGVSDKAAKKSMSAERSDVNDPGHIKHPLWNFLDNFTGAWAKRGIVGAVIIGIIGALISTNLKIGDLDPGAAELTQESRYNRDNSFMTTNYTTSSDLFVVMLKTPAGECSRYENLIKADSLEWELRQLDGVEATSSMASFSKQATVGMNDGSARWFEIPKSPPTMNSIVTRAPRDYYNEPCSMLTIYVYLHDHKAETLSSVVKAVEDFSSRNSSPDAQIIQAAGTSGIEAATNIVVKKANSQMLFLVYGAVIILAFVTFRSWRAVLCAVLPLMLTSILCEALMVLLGIGVKVATLPVIALGVGIGVDYALYMLTVTLARLREGMTLSQAYYRALLFTGKVVVLTGVTLSIAVGTWAYSPIKFQADMGVLLAFMFLLNMIGSMILIPSLANIFLKQKVN